MQWISMDGGVYSKWHMTHGTRHSAYTGTHNCNHAFQNTIPKRINKRHIQHTNLCWRIAQLFRKKREKKKEISNAWTESERFSVASIRCHAHILLAFYCCNYLHSLHPAGIFGLEFCMTDSARASTCIELLYWHLLMSDFNRLKWVVTVDSCILHFESLDFFSRFLVRSRITLSEMSDRTFHNLTLNCGVLSVCFIYRSKRFFTS